MITQIIKLLQSDAFYGVSQEVEIAKGKYKIVKDWVNFKEQIKREWLTKNT